MLKKIVTLVLSILMLSMPASAALVDIADEAYGEEIALLYDLGLVEGKEADLFMPADNLTRAEMTTIILRLLGADGTTPASFSDVPEDHWASKIIGTAAQMKIVNGISETEFAPEAAVTYPQAVKMLVCALGYDVHAEAMGGYPSGYLSKASQIGVLDGTKDNGEAISRAMMAKLVANALEVNILVRTGYGDAYTYEEKENATLLNTYLGIEVIAGKVTANNMLNLGGAAARDGQFSVGETVISEGTTNGSSFLGRTVAVYAKEKDDEYTALSVVPKYEDGYTEIDASDILPSSTLTSIEAEVNEKKVRFDVAADAVWVYNGVVKRDMTPADLIFDIGNVALISEDGTAAETVFVYSYKNLIVDSVRTDLNKVIFKNPSEGLASLIIDTTDTSAKISLKNDDGADVKLEDLKEWDVLSIAANGKVSRIIRSTRTVSGKVTETTTDSAIIDGEKYDFAANLFRNTEFDLPAVDMEANFFLDFTGKIAALDTESFRAYKYGYLVSVYKAEGIDKDEQVKIYTEDGKMKLFTLADNFVLNDAPTETLLSESGNAVYQGGNVKRQLIRYEASATDALLTIETAWDIKENRDTVLEEERLSRFTEEKFYESAGLYGPPARMYDFKYMLQAKTTVFRVPANYTGDDTLFHIIDPMSIGHMSSYGMIPKLTLYDIDEDGIISAMVTEDGGAGAVEYFGVITKTAKTLSESGETLNALKLLTDTGEATITLSDDASLSLWTTFNASGYVESRSLSFADLKTGDIIWYARPNSIGECTALRVMHRSDITTPMRRTFENATTTKASMSVYPGNILTFGPVVHTSQYSAIIQHPSRLDGTGATTSMLSYENVKRMYLYDRVRDTFTEITAADIYEGDTVFSCRMNLQEMIFVIYR